jgi:hypothetical protein
MRSTVRRLAFGPEDYLHPLNYLIGATVLDKPIEGIGQDQGLTLAEPGRSAWIFPFARELLAFLDEISTRITADPTTVLPHRLAPLLIRTGLNLPLARRAQTGDAELLRLLTQQTGDRELFVRTTPNALSETGLPILHRHGLIRHDRPLPDLTFALHAVLTGFSATLSGPATALPAVNDPDQVIADTVAQLLEPPTVPGQPAIAAAAEETLLALRPIQDALLGLIERSQSLHASSSS